MRPVTRTRPERGLFVVGTLLLAAVVVGWAAERSQEATGPAVVRLTDIQSGVTSMNGTPTGVGAVQIATLKLFGSSTRSRPIGSGVLTCMTVSKTQRSCTGSYVLPRGMIETSGLLNSRLLYTAAITGGTGLYDNARGTLTVTAKGLKPRRELLLFRLSG
jgi:hypothetical protein